MDMIGSFTIAADRATVWAALNDPKVLGICIPGTQEISGMPQDGCEAVVVQKVGPVTAKFKGKVHAENVVEGVSYTLVGEGSGGVAGFAKGSADVALADVEAGTELTYTVNAKVGGKLAALGSRVIDGFAKKMADQFFENLRNAVEPPSEEDSVEEDAPAT